MSTVTTHNGFSRPFDLRQGHSVTSTEYRPDIDGLRAVAVLAVVVYHAWPNWLVGGFIGVDIFFVISGFLITKIIISEARINKFIIVDFYSRRIVRLFPALFAMLAAVLVFGWATMLSTEFRQLGAHAAAGAGFMANILLWYETGYFDQSSTAKPLLHLWSLGVEEQFYLVWPLVIIFSIWSRVSFLVIAALLVTASFAANMALVETHSSAAFYFPFTRFWQLGAGGILAYLQIPSGVRSGGYSNAMSVLGVGCLIYALAVITPQDPYPSWLAILPVAGTILLIMAGPNALPNKFVLSSTLAVKIGLISYPLYLWHWPLISFAYIILGETPSWLVKISLILVSFVLAYMTYKFLEMPLRQACSRKVAVPILSSGVALIFLAGVLVSVGGIRERIQVNGAEVYLDALNERSIPGGAFSTIRHRGISFSELSSKGGGRTVFLGDSTMEHYAPYVEQALSSGGSGLNSAVFATTAGCPPIPNTVRLPRFKYPLCPVAIDAAYDLASQDEVDTVVMGALWYYYFDGKFRDLMYAEEDKNTRFPDPGAVEAAYESLKQSVLELTRKGKRVYILLPAPFGPEFDPRTMFVGSRFGSIEPVQTIPNLRLSDFVARHAEVRRKLLAIATATGANIIDPTEFLCIDAVCPVLRADGSPRYTDGGHMRPGFSQEASHFLLETLRPQVNSGEVKY